MSDSDSSDVEWQPPTLELDSSDVEWEPPKPKLRRDLGRESIDSMAATHAEDRLESKRTFKQLQFGSNLPNVRLAQSLWVQRFEDFRKTTLKQDVNKPFNGEDLFRFISVIVGKSSASITRSPTRTDTAYL